MGKLGNISAKPVPKCGPGVQVLFWGNKDSPKFKTESPKSKVLISPNGATACRHGWSSARGKRAERNPWKR
jgi:hypothetical protein